MGANFQELLSKQVESVEPPKLWPQGHYDAIVLGHECKESSQKGTPLVRFIVKLLAPREDIENEEFEAAGGMEKLQSKNYNLDFYLTDDAFYRLRQFLESSLQLQASGRTFDAVLPEAKNIQYIQQVRHERNQQREGEFFMRLADTAAAE